jgi:Tol biopolymer transport system component
VYFTTYPVKHDKPLANNWQLPALDLATGQARLVCSFPGSQGREAAIAAGPTGRYLLVEYDPHPGTTRLARFDVATGQVTQLTDGRAIEAAIAW